MYGKRKPRCALWLGDFLNCRAQRDPHVIRPPQHLYGERPTSLCVVSEHLSELLGTARSACDPLSATTAWKASNLAVSSKTRPATSQSLPIATDTSLPPATVSPRLTPPCQDHQVPPALYNIGNTCYMNALLQCCRQVLARIPPHLLPQSDRCPLSMPLRGEHFTREDVTEYGQDCP